jgi:hypothetical protein
MLPLIGDPNESALQGATGTLARLPLQWQIQDKMKGTGAGHCCNVRCDHRPPAIRNHTEFRFHIMTEEVQILIARLLAHQTLRREDKLVKRALSDEIFRTELDARLKACGMKFVDNVYADYVTLALTRDSESKVFGTKETWQNNNFGLARWRCPAGGVVVADYFAETRTPGSASAAEEDQNDMFGKEKPLPRRRYLDRHFIPRAAGRFRRQAR